MGIVCSCAALQLTGCGSQRTAGQSDAGASASVQEQTALQSSGVNAVTEKPDETVRETESEAETQPLITSVEYTSKDGSVRITLPDNGWKVTQDADEMRVFSSSDDAMINIVHASTDASMKTLTVQTSKTELEAALTKQYSDSSAYEVESYETVSVGDVDLYRYVVQYNAAARMWAYSITYGIVAPDQAYVITGTVPDENRTMLTAVEDSVDSFTVIKDEELADITASGFDTVQSESALQSESTGELTAAQEEATLRAYAAAVTMYTNDDAVNVRSQPSTDSAVIDALSVGTAVSVTGETSGWYQVSISSVKGYIRKDFLSTVSGKPASSSQSETTESGASQDNSSSAAELAAATTYSSSLTMYATDGVMVRSQPGTDAAALGSLGAGSSVTVIGETDNWYIVSTGTGTGYVSKGYLTETNPSQNGGSGTGGNGSAGGSSETESSTISGTVTGVSGTTVTVASDDGHTYAINTANAVISVTDGLYAGAKISATVDNSQTAADGTRYATSVAAY